jgi:hypothetical protein
MEHKELYETRNFRTAESRIYTNPGQAIIACLTFSKKHTEFAGCWYTSRVSDGAMYDPTTKSFSRRVYTPAGDSIRLERAAKRALDVEVSAA